ncbi:response regulator [Halosimplex rubrum]|uniref:histidine kinase n=1 Tax=Halosimplex rubrum TaxID=869889 RepID=A0A7D5P464_9EURY|nr:response regulator [Halosimplex rubrum]QLH76958.1 response regulator [Halosimplex rubrum]
MTPSSPNPIRILHVDDEPDFAEMAADFLEGENERFDIETATTAADALATLDERSVDCIVSDYEMPGMHGIEFLERVRADHPDLPFILYTGKGSEEVASDAISAGVTDYLQKETGTDQYTILANRIANAVERARAEQSQQRHLSAIETAQEGISILDGGEFVYVNEAYADLYGYDREELLGEHWGLLYPDDDIETLREDILPRVEANGHWQGETIGLRADGTTFVENHRLATTEHGELVCTVLDAQSQYRQKQAIRELHNTARALIEASTAEEVANIAVDAVRDILDIPGNGLHLYDEAANGLDPVAWTDRTETLVGTPPTIGPGEGLAWKAYERGDPHVYDDVSTNSDRFSEDTPVRSQILLPLDDHGVHLLGATEPDAFDELDVSLAKTVATHTTAALDRVAREEELARQNERLSTFASIVSHDLRNPLNVAITRLELAREECDCRYHEDIDRALDRTASLLDDLHAYAEAGSATLDPELVDLAGLCETSWRHVDTGEATLVTETDQRVRADPSRLQELLGNLVRNAVTHGGDGVTVTVGDLPTGFYVADDGPGIPDDDRETVFERGYSTTEDGTGFGLAIVAELVTAHDWEIRATESDAGGARFEITGVDTSAASDC